MFNTNPEQAQHRSLELERVIVHIWTSAVNIDHLGEHVGHTSLAIGDDYVSLWPDQGSGPVRTSQFLDNLDKDIEYERRPPELTFCFYTLKKYEMLSAFKEYKSSNKGWSMLGKWVPSDNVDSCVSLVWKLLAVGGIRALLSNSGQVAAHCEGSSKGSAFGFFDGQGSKTIPQGSAYAAEQFGAGFAKFDSPDALATCLKEANKVELKTHVSTQGIAYEGEWRPDGQKSTQQLSK